MAILGLSATSPASVLTQNFEAAEHHMLPEGRLLWIDSICINQANNIEREAQVKLMSRIYQQADCIHGDLGYAGETGGQEFLDLLQDIIKAGISCDADQLASAPSHLQESHSHSYGAATILSALASQWHNYESKGIGTFQTINLPSPAARSLGDQGIPPEDDKVWTYWKRFLDSPYFQRLWIVREFSLAKTVTLWFADISIEPEMIADCLAYISKYSINKGFYCILKASMKPQ